MSFRDWPRLIAWAYDHLKPGGYLELSLTPPRTCCGDGRLDFKTSHFAESCQSLFRHNRENGNAFGRTREMEG